MRYRPCRLWFLRDLQNFASSFTDTRTQWKKANDLAKVPIVSNRADLLEARRDGIGLAIVILGRSMLSTHDGKRKRKRGNLEKVSIKIHYCAIPYAKMSLRKDESLRAVICRLEVYKYRRTHVYIITRYRRLQPILFTWECLRKDDR